MKLDVFEIEEGFIAVAKETVKKGDWFLSLTDDESFMQIFFAEKDLSEYEDDDDEEYRKVIATSMFQIPGLPIFQFPKQEDIQTLAKRLYDKWSHQTNEYYNKMPLDLFTLALQDEELKLFYDNSNHKDLVWIEVDKILPGIITIKSFQFK